MDKPKTYIGSDYIAGEIGDKRIYCTKERFTADLGQGHKEIDVPVEDLGTGTDNIQINYETGLLWIIGVKI